MCRDFSQIAEFPFDQDSRNTLDSSDAESVVR